MTLVQVKHTPIKKKPGRPRKSEASKPRPDAAQQDRKTYAPSAPQESWDKHDSKTAEQLEKRKPPEYTVEGNREALEQHNERLAHPMRIVYDESGEIAYMYLNRHVECVNLNAPKRTILTSANRAQAAGISDRQSHALESAGKINMSMPLGDKSGF